MEPLLSLNSNLKSNTTTVDSLIFVGYQFSWISWEQGNHEFKCSTKYKFSKGMHANFSKTTNLNILEYVRFSQSTKIGSHENK